MFKQESKLKEWCVNLERHSRWRRLYSDLADVIIFAERLINNNINCNFESVDEAIRIAAVARIYDTYLRKKLRNKPDDKDVDEVIVNLSYLIYLTIQWYKKKFETDDVSDFKDHMNWIVENSLVNK